MKMRWLVVAVVMLLAATIAAVIYLHRQHDRGTPYRAAMPQRNVLGLTARAGGGCASADGLPTPKVDKLAPRVWVDADPVSGGVLWRPGLNSRACKARIEHLDGARATAFAKAVEQAPLATSAARHCPMDDGSGATVFLRYKSQQDAEVVRIGLRGCGGLSAPGRTGRETGGALAPLGAPPAGIH